MSVFSVLKLAHDIEDNFTASEFATADLPQNDMDDLRSAFEQDFYFACKIVFESSFENSWLTDTVHKPVCDCIADYKNNTRIAVCLPRDWLKSTIVSVYYSIWRAMKNSSVTSMITLNTFTNACKKLAAVRSILLNNGLLRALFPERMPDSTCTVSNEAITLPRPAGLADATFTAAGIGTQVTSRHFDILIEDDTIAPEIDHMTGDVMQPTPEQVEKAIGFHKVAHFLLSDFKTAQRIFVGTRWLEKDGFTYIAEQEPNYKLITRAVREKDGKPDLTGDLVYPERFDKPVLDEMRNAVGEYMYMTLMMNMPMSGKNMPFKQADIMFYDIMPQTLFTYTTVDPAPSDEKSLSSSDPDYNVVLTVGFEPNTGYLYVLDLFRERCNPGKLIDEIFKQQRLWSSITVGVETVAYQKTLMYWIRQKMQDFGQFFQIKEVNTGRQKKVARILGLDPLLKDKKLYLRTHHRVLVNELVTFPYGVHDDIVDALAMQLEIIRFKEHMSEKRKEILANPMSGASLLQEIRDRYKVPSSMRPYDTLNWQGIVNDRFVYN